MATDHESFWMQQNGHRRQRLSLNDAGVVATDGLDADVVIIGGGLSGLWTAYHLTEAEPTWRIVILEAHTVGYGASGRNGGWLSSLIPGNRAEWADQGRLLDRVVALQRAMVDGIHHTCATAAAHGINIDAAQGGNVVVATTEAGVARLRARRDTDLRYGLHEHEVQWLDAESATAHLNVRGTLAGLYYPDVTRIDPAKLVVGLAEVVEKRGVRIYEHSPVHTIAPGAVEVGATRLTAPRIVIATEGYSGPLVGRRRIVPVNSSMIATQQLTEAEWAHIGWAGNECLSDAAHTFIYAQRTADGRIAIGGRGNPYRFASGTGDGRTPTPTVDLLLRRLHDYFPAVEFRADHAWSGVLGVTRDWCTSVRFDHSTGIGHTLGYAGHGVTTANVASRSLADLMLRRDTVHSTLPWVDHRSPSWEPEPIRWLGIHTMYRLFRVADRWEEARHAPRTSLIARFAGKLAGLG